MASTRTMLSRQFLLIYSLDLLIFVILYVVNASAAMEVTESRIIKEKMVVLILFFLIFTGVAVF